MAHGRKMILHHLREEQTLIAAGAMKRVATPK